MTARTLRSWFVPLGIIVITGLLIALIVLQAKNGGAGVEAQGEQEEAVDLSFVEAREETDVQAAGPVDAPVGLVVYSDYQCPFCARWSNEVLPLMLDYAERGELRIEWRDVNQYGADSERAALAAHAAGQQDAFWEFHDALFPGGEHLSPDQLSAESLSALAGSLGLDVERFVADLDAEASLEAVQGFAAEGRELGVSGTPTFVLGGEPLVGAQPESVFTDLVDRKLAEAR